MRHNHLLRYTAYGLVLVLTVSQITACTNTAQNTAETNPTITQEEVTRPPSISITEAAPEEIDSEPETVAETGSKEPETQVIAENVSETQTEIESEEPTEALGETEPIEEEPITEESTILEEKTTEDETVPSKESTEPEPTEVMMAEQPTEPETTIKETTSIQPVELPTTLTAEYTGVITINTPSASGTEVYTGNSVTIDASNKASGYIMVKYEGGGDKRVKVRVSLNGVNYDYDLNTAGSYEAYPLQMGNGNYNIIVMQNVYDNQYAILHTASFNAEISNALGPYLYPVQKISFTTASKAVKKSFDLCVGLTTDEEKITAIYNYITQNIVYDYDKAAQVTSGVLTSYNSQADATLENGKGICTDYATLMAVMLRAQNIPTQMIFGSEASASYHAWNKVYYNGNWVLYDATYGAGGATGSAYTEQKRY